MKITIEETGKEPVVFEGDIALVSVGTLNAEKGTIDGRHFSHNYDGVVGYALQCRMLTAQAAELNKRFNDSLQYINTAKAEGEGK